MKKENTMNPTPATAEEKTALALWEDRKNSFQADPYDTTALCEFGKAIARSVLRKLADPQAKRAMTAEKVSDSGQNPFIVSMRNGLRADLALLDELASSGNVSMSLELDKDGYFQNNVISKSDKERWDSLSGDVLSDGMDIYQETILALCELRAKYYTPGNSTWFDDVYTERKLSRHVYTMGDHERLIYKDSELTPGKEVFRMVRRYVQAEQSVKADTSKYTYIAQYVKTDDNGGVYDTLYIRSKAYADIGGYAKVGDIDNSFSGMVSGDETTLFEIDRLVKAMNLTRRQEQVLEKRLQGMSVREIAKAHGVTERPTMKTLEQIRTKATATLGNPLPLLRAGSEEWINALVDMLLNI